MRRVVAAALLLAGCAGAPPPTGPSPATPHGIVRPDSLAAWLARGPVRVLDARTDVFAFLRGHLPAAQFLHIETLRATRDGVPAQVLPPTARRAIFERLGLHADVPVVVTGNGESVNIDATFVAWLLVAAGHPSVHVLDGGVASWEGEHRPMTQAYAADVRSGAWPSSRRALATEVTLDELLGLRASPEILLVDARPPEQFRGEAGSQMRRGHIPGAVSRYWADDLRREGFGLVWKPRDELRREYATRGIVPERDIIVYCNSSTEASHVWWTLRILLGYPRVRIYAGAWTEWAGRADLPIATGP